MKKKRGILFGVVFFWGFVFFIVFFFWYKKPHTNNFLWGGAPPPPPPLFVPLRCSLFLKLPHSPFPLPFPALFRPFSPLSLCLRAAQTKGEDRFCAQRRWKRAWAKDWHARNRADGCANMRTVRNKSAKTDVRFCAFPSRLFSLTLLFVSSALALYFPALFFYGTLSSCAAKAGNGVHGVFSFLVFIIVIARAKT